MYELEYANEAAPPANNRYDEDEEEGGQVVSHRVHVPSAPSPGYRRCMESEGQEHAG